MPQTRLAALPRTATSVNLHNLFQIEPVSQPAASDWDHLIQTASEELLLPALWHRVQALNLTAEIPATINHFLQITEFLNAERNQFILAEAAHVATLLNQIGIEPVALKGLAYLLTSVYTSQGTRYLQDIDLLIPESQLPRAVQLLGQHGFLTDKSDPLAAFRHHEPGLHRPHLPTIELHHSVGLGVCRRILPTAEILRDAGPINLNGARFLVPSPTNLVSHLILHSQLHNSHRESVFPPLRALYDLQLLSQNPAVDWPCIAKTYRQHGHYLTLAMHLKEAERTLGLPAPFPLKLGLFGSIAWRNRLLLARHPTLRFVNPAYLLPVLFARRLRMLRAIIRQPKKWPYFAKALVSPLYYRNFFRI